MAWGSRSSQSSWGTGITLERSQIDLYIDHTLTRKYALALSFKADSGFALQTLSKPSLNNERKQKHSHHVLVCLVVQVDLKGQLHPERMREVIER